MRWRSAFDEPRPRRPKVRSLTAAERDQLVAAMTMQIAASPVLSAFDVQVQPAYTSSETVAGAPTRSARTKVTTSPWRKPG